MIKVLQEDIKYQEPTRLPLARSRAEPLSVETPERVRVLVLAIANASVKATAFGIPATTSTVTAEFLCRLRGCTW